MSSSKQTDEQAQSHWGSKMDVTRFSQQQQIKLIGVSNRHSSYWTIERPRRSKLGTWDYLCPDGANLSPLGLIKTLKTEQEKALKAVEKKGSSMSMGLTVQETGLLMGWKIETLEREPSSHSRGGSSRWSWRWARDLSEYKAPARQRMVWSYCNLDLWSTEPRS